jgi:enoyl-CoA hydratase/carnithine racemase
MHTNKYSLEIIGHTALITLTNPPANTFDTESLGALPKTIETLNQNTEVYALVITGSGEKFFSAGADLKLFKDSDKAIARSMARLFGQAFEAITDFRGVSIAAINGYAMGGGLECALACDIRIAESQSQMALPEATVGLMPCAGGTQNLSWLVGEGWAKRMILLGERINAETALKIGLIEEICEKGTAKSRALELAKLAEKQSPVSLAACKRLVQSARHQPMFPSLSHEREAFVDLFDSEDQREGVNAFLEKRAAVWKGR